MQQSPIDQARALAVARGFTASSLPEVGALLAALTASVERGRIGEIGTGCGVGAAWIVAALQPGATLWTIDADPELVAATRALFAPYAAVHVLEGDWPALAAHGPFRLLFADGGKAKQERPDAIIDMLAPGGMLVLDDLTPEEYWPEEWRGRPDPLRTFWLTTERVRAVELRVTARHAVILATRSPEAGAAHGSSADR